MGQMDVGQARVMIPCPGGGTPTKTVMIIVRGSHEGAAMGGKVAGSPALASRNLFTTRGELGQGLLS